MRVRTLGAGCAIGLALVLGCSGETAMEESEGMAEQLGDNVEHSGELMKETYEESRKKGEGAVEAAGDAYESVEKAAEK